MAKFKINKRTVAIFTAFSLFLGMTSQIIPYKKVDAATVQKQAQTMRNVMYYGDWSIWGGEGNFYPKDIPADQLTHLNLAFIDFDENGNFIYCDKDAMAGAPVGMPGVQWQAANAGLINAFQQLRAENPNLKIGISIGGWSKSKDFSPVAANPTARANFVSNIVKFIDYGNFDFVDLDWEYPGEKRDPDKVDNQNDEGTPLSSPEDKANYITLLQDIRTAIDKLGVTNDKQYELSVALPVANSKVDSGIDVAKLFSVVDFANIMTYDAEGAWADTSGHQSALYTNPNSPNKGRGFSVDESVKNYMSKGAPSEKIVIGAAYYTRGWEKVSNDVPDGSLPGLYGKATKVNKDADLGLTYGALNYAPMKVGDGGRAGGVWPWRAQDELKAKYKGLKEYWDDTAKAPYLYSAETGAFFTYDNPRSIQEKAKYVKDNNLGGMIAWMASQDKATTSTKRDELTKATKNALFGTAALPVQDVKYGKLDVTATVKPYKESWGTGGGFEITVTNNERLTEANEAMRMAERAGETIKSPKLYVKSEKPLKAGEYTAGQVTTQNGYTVVDISTVYEAQTLEPGKSYTFKLAYTDGIAPVSASEIKSVEISQRIYQSSPVEIQRQTIFGSTTPEPNKAPVINGATNKTIYVGDAFDALAGITVTDDTDKNLVPTVTGTVDTTKAGSYTLTYTATDSGKLTTTVTRVITVQPKPANTAPVINGVGDKTIYVGDSFNPLAGVTVTDDTDKNLVPVVTGTVDTTKAGSYTLTYTVTDSGKLTTTVSCVITVKEKTNPPVGDTFDPTKIYNTGDKVVYKGATYTCKWWSQGGTPDTSAAWEKDVATNPDKSVDYTPGKAYNGGTIVKYNGVNYKANWWTNSVPGSDSSWTKL